MLVSVIIPCYNQGKFLDAALNSVLNQTYTNWECIMVDDGSTDNTRTIAENWGKKDKRFQYYYKENGGVSSTRNFGLDKADGDFLQFLDCDDLLDKEKLELSINEFRKNETLQMVISNFNMISEDGKTISSAFCKLHPSLFTLEGFLYKWNKTFSIQMQCGFFKSSLFKHIRFPENLSAQEDWLVWVQLMKISTEIVFIDKPLAFYRTQPESRMRTIGIDNNQLKMLDNFKEVLEIEEYHKFAKYQLENYYAVNNKLRSRITKLKKSNPYQFGLFGKKVANKLGLLKLSRRLFKQLLKFKAK